MLLALPGHSEVLQADAVGFTAGGKIISTQPLARVWQELMSVANWWEDSHSFSANAANMVFDVEGACFCERWDGNEVRHLELVHLRKQKKLVFRGALGPLQDQAIVGALSIELKPADDNVSVHWQYRVYGRLTGDMGEWSKAVDGVLSTQFGNLQKRLQ